MKNIGFLCFITMLTILVLKSCTIYPSFLAGEDVILNPPSDKPQQCGSNAFYAPDSSTPIQYIRVNFHIMRDGNGENSFTEEEGIKYMRNLLYLANKKLKANRAMNLPVGNETPVLPIQYQYVLTADTKTKGDQGIYFHDDEELYYYLKKGKDRNLYNTAVFNKYGSRKDEVLNIFFLPHHPDSAQSKTYNVDATGIAFPSKNWVKISGMYHLKDNVIGGTKEKPLKSGEWFCVGILNHEIGHVLGLHHTWNTGDGCDDTPKNSNCWAKGNSGKCKTNYSNNMMDYNTYQNALTPCQLGRIHKNFANVNSSQRKMLKKTWCTFDESKSIYITEPTVWKGAKDLHGNLYILEGASLKVQCRLHLPKGGRIIISENATLTLDGAVLDNDCGELWQGIQVMGKGTTKGKVVFEKIPTISNVVNKIDFEAILKNREGA